MKVLLIFAFSTIIGVSLSTAISLGEMILIVRVSRAGNPSSLRFLLTVHELQVRIKSLKGWAE